MHSAALLARLALKIRSTQAMVGRSTAGLLCIDRHQRPAVGLRTSVMLHSQLHLLIHQRSTIAVNAGNNFWISATGEVMCSGPDISKRTKEPLVLFDTSTVGSATQVAVRPTSVLDTHPELNSRTLPVFVLCNENIVMHELKFFSRNREFRLTDSQLSVLGYTDKVPIGAAVKLQFPVKTLAAGGHGSITHAGGYGAGDENFLLVLLTSGTVYGHGQLRKSTGVTNNKSLAPITYLSSGAGLCITHIAAGSDFCIFSGVNAQSQHRTLSSGQLYPRVAGAAGSAPLGHTSCWLTELDGVAPLSISASAQAGSFVSAGLGCLYQWGKARKASRAPMEDLVRPTLTHTNIGPILQAHTGGNACWVLTQHGNLGMFDGDDQMSVYRESRDIRAMDLFPDLLVCNEIVPEYQARPNHVTLPGALQLRHHVALLRHSQGVCRFTDSPETSLGGWWHQDKSSFEAGHPFGFKVEHPLQMDFFGSRFQLEVVGTPGAYGCCSQPSCKSFGLRLPIASTVECLCCGKRVCKHNLTEDEKEWTPGITTTCSSCAVQRTCRWDQWLGRHSTCTGRCQRDITSDSHPHMMEYNGRCKECEMPTCVDHLAKCLRCERTTNQCQSCYTYERESGQWCDGCEVVMCDFCYDDALKDVAGFLFCDQCRA